MADEDSRNKKREHFNDHDRIMLAEQDLDGFAVTAAGLKRAMNTNTAALLAVFVALVSALAVTALK